MQQNINKYINIVIFVSMKDANAAVKFHKVKFQIYPKICPHLSNDLPGGRVDGWERLARLRVDPLVVDEDLCGKVRQQKHTTYLYSVWTKWWSLYDGLYILV